MCHVRLSSKTNWMTIVLCVIIPVASDLTLAAQQDAKSTEPTPPKFIAGKTTKVKIPGARIVDKKDKEFVVYVPTDYTDARKWPVIFSFAGLGGSAAIEPIKSITQGKGFIVVGVAYYMRGKEGYKHYKRDIQNLKKVVRYLGRYLEIDKKQLFLGGFSKGAFYSSIILCATPKTWAGALILGGGRGKGDAKSRHSAALRGKPIFIGCGTKDVHMKYAKTANTYYRSLKADVTFEKWSDLGHSCNSQSQKLRKWLLVNGPLKHAKSEFGAASKLEKANRLGKAFNIYNWLGQIDNTNKLCMEADKRAQAIAQQAEKELSDADEAIGDKRYVEATKLLVKLADQYGDSPFGKEATQQLETLKSDPQITATIKQAEMNADADAIEARAKAAEQAKRYAKAISLYELYVAKHMKASRYGEVKKHLEMLKADKTIQSSILKEESDRKCRGWLALADSYISAGMYDNAQKYLNKIIDKYGNTEWGQKARDRQAKIAGKAR